MTAIDMRRRAAWLDAVARRVDDARSARHLAFCARALSRNADELEPWRAPAQPGDVAEPDAPV